MDTRRAGLMLIALALALGACQSASRKPATFVNQQTPPGSGAGQLPSPDYGSTFPGGAVLGGIADSDIARSLGDTDRQRAAQAEHFALETAEAGRSQAWSNPETGIRGTVVVGEAYRINRSQCRDYTHTIVTSDGERTLRATACRQPNGSWRSVSG